MKLSICIHQFFDQYLPRIKGVSIHTIKSYRVTFTLFLPFAARYLSIKVGSLKIEHLSSDLVFSFLDHLETQRNNSASTRNYRLAALKSLAKMIRLMYPEKQGIAERIWNIPKKRTQKQLIGFIHQEEILKVFETVDLKKSQGLRDYCLLHLLNDSGARASEIATLNLDYFDPQQKTLAILGKENHYRLINLWPRTVQLIKLYIGKYRTIPKPLYRQRLFINQRGEEFTRHGIYHLCKKYLSMALSPKRLKNISPVHSFRHACAVNMLSSGFSIPEIKNHLGHQHTDSTMIYSHLEMSYKREVQKKFYEHTQSIIPQNMKIEELINWENKKETLNWLDNL